MSATMFGSFVFTPICFFLCLALSMLFLIISLYSCSTRFSWKLMFVSFICDTTGAPIWAGTVLPSVAHVLLFGFNGVFCEMQCWSLFLLSLVCLMLSVSLEFPFLIALSVFSNVYIIFVGMQIYFEMQYKQYIRVITKYRTPNNLTKGKSKLISI